MALGLAETAKLAVDLSLKGNFSSQLAASQRSLKGFDAAVSRSGSRAFKAGQQVGQGFLNAGRLIAVGATAAAAGLVSVLKVAGDFESQLNTINTIAHANAASLGQIGESIRKVARDTGTPLADLTQGYYDLLSAGVKVADAQQVLVEANKLAIGGLSTTAESVDLLTTALNVYGGGAKAAATDADLFAKAIERGKVTAADLAGSFALVGNIAKNAGIGLDEITAGFARLTAAGTPAAEAATQMRSAIQALTKTTPDLEKLQKATGKNYLAIAGKQGLVAALQQMRVDATKAHIPLALLTGRIEAQQFILATTGPNFAAYNADLAAMGKASGTAAAQMAEREKGLNFQLGILKARLKDAAIVIGSELLPKITPVFQKLNDALADPKVIAGIKQFGVNLAGLFSDKNIGQLGDAISHVFDTARAAAPVLQQAASATLGIVKAAVGLFMSLPKEIQGLAVGAFAINKLTGGLVTNLAGGLFDVLNKARGASPANPVFVADISGGLGGAGAAGGKGLLGTVAKAALAVTVVGIVAEAAVPIGKAFADFLPKELKGPGGLGKTDSQLAAEHNAAARGAPGVSIATAIAQGLAAAQGAVAITQGGFDRRVGRSLQDQQIAHLAEVMKAGTSATLGGFRAMIAALRSAKTSKEIAAAVKAAVALVVDKGRGNAAATATLLSDLRKKLGATHDPKLAAILRSAISKVEAKLPGRQFASAQLAKADALLRDGKVSQRDLKTIAGIERALKDHGLPAAAAKIGAQVDAAKRAQVAASKAAGQVAAAAIRDKEFALNLKLQTTTSVSLRSMFTAATTAVKFGNVSSGSSIRQIPG